MSACRTASTTLRRRLSRAIKFLLLVAVIVGAAVGAVWCLTDPGRPQRPAAIVQRRASLGTARIAARSTVAPAPQRQVPLYSEDWTDDSGQGLAFQFSLPITDPRSLEQIRTSSEKRGERGIEKLRKELAAVDRQTPASRARAQLDTFLGILHMSIGEFTEADRLFAEAQVADPTAPGCWWRTSRPFAGSRHCVAARRKTALPAATARAASSRWRPKRFTRAPPGRATRSATSPPTSSSDPRTWASSGS